MPWIYHHGVERKQPGSQCQCTLSLILGRLGHQQSWRPRFGRIVTFAAPGTGASATFAGGINRVRTNVSGVAGIGLIANTTAGSYSVSTAASGGSSTSFNLTNLSGAATKFSIAEQPTDTAYGDIISPAAVTVDVVDQYNNLVTSTASITIAFGTDPTSALLGGTLLVNAVGGVATFSDLTVSEVGTAYTLVATSSGLGAAPASSSFNITPRSITVTAAANTKGTMARRARRRSRQSPRQPG